VLENDCCLIGKLIIKMKKTLSFFVVLIFLIGCKKELVKKPNHLIEKDKMVNIMYDLSLLEAIKNQNYSSADSLKINSNEYIFKKYKIDSLQFAKSNIYYAADYKEYQKMFEQIKARLNKNKSQLESILKDKKKKDALQAKSRKKLKLKKEADSIKKAMQDLKIKKETDSIKKNLKPQHQSIHLIKKRKNKVL